MWHHCLIKLYVLGFLGSLFFPSTLQDFTFEQYPLQYVSATTDVAMNDFGDALCHYFPHRSPSMVIYTLSEPSLFMSLFHRTDFRTRSRHPRILSDHMAVTCVWGSYLVATSFCNFSYIPFCPSSSAADKYWFRSKFVDSVVVQEPAHSVVLLSQ